MTDAAMTKKGLEGVVIAQTRLSKVFGDEGRLIYCGYDIHDLAQHASFEEVVYLLWHKELPTRAQLDDFKASKHDCTEIPDFIFDHMTYYAKNAHPMAALRTAVSGLAMWDPVPDDTTPEHIAHAACQITWAMPAIIAGWERIRNGKEPIASRDGELDHAANFLWMLKGEAPDALSVRVLDTYLILLADHGMNASTFAARVTTSTLSDLYSAITSAIGTLKGAAHGGANEAAMRQFVEIGAVENVEPWFRKARAEGRRIMGIGHRVYKTQDPRAVELAAIAEKLAEQKGGDVLKYFTIAKKLVEVARADDYFIERNLYPNVDYYSAVALHAVGVPIDQFTPIFAMSRIAGWTAHILEQWADNRLIRPRGDYVGPDHLTWKPIDAR
ncbi:MAG: citrate synthase [Anaerolineae bacterium]|nr:citrate synthase [Anaerolineae bacterium]